MPSVVGMPAEAAKTKLALEAFTSVHIKLVHEASCNAGLVCRQSTKLGSKASFGVLKILYLGRPTPSASATS